MTKAYCDNCKIEVPFSYPFEIEDGYKGHLMTSQTINKHMTMASMSKHADLCIDCLYKAVKEYKNETPRPSA